MHAHEVELPLLFAPALQCEDDELHDSSMCCALALLCPGLRSLAMNGQLSRPGCFTALSHLRSLKQLSCGTSLLPPHLQDCMPDLARMTQLTRLDLRVLQLTTRRPITPRDLDLSPLAALGQLQHLRLSTPGICLTGTQALGRSCAKLADLHLHAASVQQSKAEQEQEQGQGQRLACSWPALTKAHLEGLAAGSLDALGLQPACAL